MTECTVSVIVATYRRQETLQRALGSLGDQTYPDMEIIVVDDNDEPEWNRLTESVVRRYPNVRYIQNHPNMGSAKTRNIGIEAVRGEYITFLDDDDEYLPRKVERQAGFMRKNGLDYCLTNLDLYYENGILCEHRRRDYIEKTDADSLLAYHLMHHMTGTDVMMFRRDYLMKIGMFDPINVGDEFYLMQKAILGGGRFGWLDGCDVRAYVHTGEGGLSSGDGKIKGEMALYEDKKRFFDRLSRDQVRYIKTRHYAVLAFAEIRRRHYLAFVGNAAGAAFTSPGDCLRVLRQK